MCIMIFCNISGCSSFWIGWSWSWHNLSNSSEFCLFRTHGTALSLALLYVESLNQNHFIFMKFRNFTKKRHLYDLGWLQHWGIFISDTLMTFLLHVKSLRSDGARKHVHKWFSFTNLMFTKKKKYRNKKRGNFYMVAVRKKQQQSIDNKNDSNFGGGLCRPIRDKYWHCCSKTFKSLLDYPHFYLI